jgi:hypothetical protein
MTEKTTTIETIKLLLFEKVNENLIFRGVMKAKLKHYTRLGYYIEKPSKRLYMEAPSSDYFILGGRFKNLPVVKYGDEDYRPIKFLKGKGYYRKAEVIEYDEKEIFNEETGQKVLTKIPKLDKNSKPITKIVEDYYNEPLAVQQSDKEVMRFARDFRRKMDEKRRSLEGFWSKNAPLIINVTVIIMFFLFVVIYGKMQQAEKEALIMAWDDNAEALLEQMKEPNFIERIIDNFQQDKAAEGAPIT